MAKTATVYTRIEPELKNQAEIILEQLGLSLTSAVTMFIRQIVLQNGIPFDVRMPASAPLAYESLSREQFDAEIGKGFESLAKGDVYSSDEIKAELL